MKKIFFLFVLSLFMIGCIEDSEEFTEQIITTETNDTIIMLAARPDSTNIRIDTIALDGFLILSGIFLDRYLENVISIELIKLSDNKSVVYYRSDINNDNYQTTKNKTIFNIDNWDKRNKHFYEYHIREEHFD